MTQFLCGHRGHTETRPNLTIQVMAALRNPTSFVGELDRPDVAGEAELDDVGWQDAAPEPVPGPQGAYVGDPVEDGPYIEYEDPPGDATSWPSTVLDWVVVAIAITAVGWLAVVLGPAVSFVVLAGFLLGVVAWFFVQRRRVGRARDDGWRVVVRCPQAIATDSHDVVFDRPAGALDTWPRYVLGAVASPGDIQSVTRYTTYADPDEAVDRLNRQATFVLGGQALFVLFLGGVVWRVTTSTEGAAVGVADVDQLVRDQPVAFSLAIAALAASFALAVLGQRTGYVGAVNLRNSAAAARAFNRALAWRSGLVHNAAVMLGVALLLAVAVPIAAATSRQPAVEIAAPVWTLTDGVWNGASTVRFTDVRGSQRLEVAAWLEDADGTDRLLRHWRNVAPARTDAGDTVAVSVDVAADQGSNLTIGVDVRDADADTTAAFGDELDCAVAVACGQFAVPDAADTTVPDIAVTSLDGPVTGTVTVPVMPLGHHLHVIVWTERAGGRPVAAYETVAGPVDARARTVPFSVPTMGDVARMTVDARIFAAGADDAQAERMRCLDGPVAPGCLSVRLD